MRRTLGSAEAPRLAPVQDHQVAARPVDQQVARVRVTVEDVAVHGHAVVAHEGLDDAARLGGVEAAAALRLGGAHLRGLQAGSLFPAVRTRPPTDGATLQVLKRTSLRELDPVDKFHRQQPAAHLVRVRVRVRVRVKVRMRVRVRVRVSVGVRVGVGVS